ncbi:MAG: hypothetical protein A2511_01495 [Deltaproteobacteria bacterium RIFOXYD12_FULL_50_9]|nr:MAG: hypothetical protein A2511_01495 [Deltaproteobacteria bacterium RIFOXYD12_FULL_50_9]
MISRRNFLIAVTAAMTVYPFRSALASQQTERVLNMFNTHTGESIDLKYYSAGIYDQKALDSINYLLRCHYTNEVETMDIRVLDLLSEISAGFGVNKRIEIISGYRSPVYNQFLLSHGRNVSKNSLHLHGLAIDFTIPGVSTDKVAKAAKSFAVGGVGQYPAEFVHIDSGRIRYW